MQSNTCAKCHATSTPEHPLKLCGRCKVVQYCNRACQEAHFQAHKVDCRKAEELFNRRRNTPAVSPKSKPTGRMEVFGHMGSGIIIMCDSNGDEVPLSADLVLSKETPDGQILFSILSPEQLAGTEDMDHEAREAYKVRMAEEESSTKGHSHEAKKLREKIRAEIMKEVEEVLGEVKKPAAALHKGTKVPIREGKAYTQKYAALAFVGLNENGDAIFRGTDGKDVVHPAGTFVIRKKPGSSAGDMLSMPLDILAATKHMTKENRSAAHQVFAEEVWAREDKGERTETEAEYQKQQMVEIDEVGSEIAVKAEEAKAVKATKKE